MSEKAFKRDKRPFSSVVVEGFERAPSRAMLRAVGFKDADFKKPQIGIASTWSMVTPCNMHIDRLARQAELGVNIAGGKAVIANGGVVEVLSFREGRSTSRMLDAIRQTSARPAAKKH